MATKTSKLLKHHLKDLASLVRYTKKTIPSLTFKKPKAPHKFCLDAYSDAAMAGKKDAGGRGAYIIFRRAGDIGTSDTLERAKIASRCAQQHHSRDSGSCQRH